MPAISRRTSTRLHSTELDNPVSPEEEDSSAEFGDLDTIIASVKLGSGSDAVSPDRRSVESTVHVATGTPPQHNSSYKAPKHETQMTTPTKGTRKNGSKTSTGQKAAQKRAGSSLEAPAKRQKDSPLTHA